MTTSVFIVDVNAEILSSKPIHFKLRTLYSRTSIIQIHNPKTRLPFWANECLYEGTRKKWNYTKEGNTPKVPRNNHSRSRISLQLQTTSTKKITLSIGMRWQSSAGNLIRLHKGLGSRQNPTQRPRCHKQRQGGLPGVPCLWQVTVLLSAATTMATPSTESSLVRKATACCQDTTNLWVKNLACFSINC